MRSLALFLSFVLFLSTAVFGADKVVSDDRLHDEVRMKLAGDRDLGSSSFDVDVKDGVVIIKGTVAKPKLKEKAEKMAKKIKGVKSVDNQIVVKAPGEI